MFEKYSEQILSEFDDTIGKYERLLEYTKTTLKSLLNEKNIKFHEIEGRLNLWFFKSCYRSLSKFKAFCVSLKQFNNK